MLTSPSVGAVTAPGCAGEVAMTVSDIEARITAIRVWAVDAEEYDKAHDIEESLWEDVLREIADGALDAPALARAALESRLVRYPRP